MDASEFIDQILGRTDNVGPTDADYTERRTRHLEYLIEEATYFYGIRDWSWRRGVTTLTIAANAGQANLPSDFGSIGRRTLLTNTVTGTKLHFIHEDEMRAKKDQTGTEADPTEYSIYGQGTDYEYQLQVPNNSIQLTIKVPYNKAFPTLDESSNENNLKVIPAQYHQTVLIPAVRSHAAFAKGDQSWQAHEAQRERGLKFMLRNERLPQGAREQFPSFFGGRIS